MNKRGLPIILVAQDDLADRLALQDAFQASGIKVDLRFVADDKELLSYLHRRPPWKTAQPPDLILLALRGPWMEVLREIKNDPELRLIPVVVLIASRSGEDIAQAYALGANTCIPKPASFEELTHAIKVFCEFWFKICVLPRTTRERSAFG